MHDSDIRLIKSAECPPFFVNFVSELVEMAGFSLGDDSKINLELSNFASGRIELQLTEILSLIERHLLAIQKQGIDGVRDCLKLLQTGGVAAVEDEIDNAIREGRAPAAMSFDLAVWEVGVQESDYGRLLNIQDLPVSARAFFENLINLSKYEINSALEDQPDYVLYLLLEGFSFFEPAEFVTQISRVFKEYVP